MKRIGIFPLELVSYPGEHLNLHVFEPRYRKLVQDCDASGSTFGIPPYINKGIQPVGTEMKIAEITKMYPDGRSDIRTTAVGKFRAVDFHIKHNTEDYSEADVISIQEDESYAGLLFPELESLIEEWEEVINMDLKIETEMNLSYAIAHKAGLSLEQEYQLLEMGKEEDRQQFLVEHLRKIIPTVKEVEKSRQLIMMNGHFRNLQPPQF